MLKRTFFHGTLSTLYYILIQNKLFKNLNLIKSNAKCICDCKVLTNDILKLRNIQKFKNSNNILKRKKP